MSVLWSNFQNFFPWIFFLAGISGSLHCVGMCGGLVTATCEKGKDIFRYQLGRLLGYLTVGALSGLLGGLVQLGSSTMLINIVPGVFIGVLFLYWGIQNYQGKKAELPLPHFMRKLYSLLWKKLIYKNTNFSKSFFTGLISIFLPCGLLYGVILAALALQHPWMAIISMFFFWLGTLPAMILAPSIFQKILTPIKNKIPKTYAISLILIGLLTISFRVVKYQEAKHPPGNQETSKIHSCH